MDPRDRSLYLGFVVGADRAQPAEVLDQFRASGLSHLSAVSGENVAFLMAVAGPGLRRLRPSSRWGATLLVIGWFAVSLPALLLALKIQRKANTLAEQGVALPITPSIGELVVAMETAPDAETVGSMLFAITDLAHRADVDPEHALRAYTSSYRDTVSERESSTD